MTERAKTLKWHMRVAVGYFFLSGLWSWVGLWHNLLVNKIPFLPNWLLFSVGFCVAAAGLLSAYYIYKRNKLAVVFITITPFLKCYGFSILFPNLFGLNDFIVDISYIKQLPPLLVADFVFYIILSFYSVFLWKRRELV